jgi:hypothetical protein
MNVWLLLPLLVILAVPVAGIVLAVWLLIFLTVMGWKIGRTIAHALDGDDPWIDDE